MNCSTNANFSVPNKPSSGPAMHHLIVYVINIIYEKSLEIKIPKIMVVDEIIKCFLWENLQVDLRVKLLTVVVVKTDEVILNSYSGSRLRPFTSYGELNLLLSYMTLYVCLMSDLCKASHPSQLGAAIKGNFHRLLTSHSSRV